MKYLGNEIEQGTQESFFFYAQNRYSFMKN